VIGLSLTAVLRQITAHITTTSGKDVAFVRAFIYENTPGSGDIIQVIHRVDMRRGRCCGCRESAARHEVTIGHLTCAAPLPTHPSDDLAGTHASGLYRNPRSSARQHVFGVYRSDKDRSLRTSASSFPSSSRYACLAITEIAEVQIGLDVV
jgi:hypothetical protein